MTERMAIELVKFNQIIRAMGESAVGESYYIKAPHKLSVLNDALRGIKTGRPNRTNRGGLTSKKLLHHTLTAGRGTHRRFAKKYIKSVLKGWVSNGWTNHE